MSEPDGWGSWLDFRTFPFHALVIVLRSYPYCKHRRDHHTLPGAFSFQVVLIPEVAFYVLMLLIDTPSLPMAHYLAPQEELRGHSTDATRTVLGPRRVYVCIEQGAIVCPLSTHVTALWSGLDFDL